MRSWKEYTPTKGRSSNPAESIEVDSWAFGGLMPISQPIFCCGSYKPTNNALLAG